MKSDWSSWTPLLVIAACAPRPGPLAETPQPNVLIVFSDDQRFDSLSVTGNPHIETPNLDRVAREGALFTRAYVSTSRCCPGRASMLTGLHATAHGVWNNHPEHDFLDTERTLADYLDEAGYETAWIGKWHLPNPGAAPVRGFDHWVSYEGPGAHFDQAFNVDGTERQSKGFQADRLTDYALEFLSRERDSDEPFFLVVAYKNPHVPMTPAARHAGLLRDTKILLPESARDPEEQLPLFYRTLRRASGRHAIDDEQAYAEGVRAYWELVLSIDDNVGRLLAALEQAGQLEHTIVVITSDNGQLLGEHGLQQKGLSYEPSIRIPLALRYPAAVRAGVEIDALTLNVDLAPTLLELCGVAMPGSMDGESLAPLLNDQAVQWRDRFLYLAPGFGGEGGMIERAVVEADWKYLRFEASDGAEEVLFNLASDPDERRDVSDDPASRATMDRMRAWMRAERGRLGDLR